MALTASEEALVRQLLDQQAAILSLAGNEATITSKLGATKVTLADLVAASSLADADLLLTRQGTTDKSVRADILAAYMGAELGALFAPIANPTFTGDPKAPTAAQFDNDTSLATTAFVQRALGNLRSLGSTNVSAALTAANIGQIYCFFGSTASQQITLPAANSVPAGAGVWLVNQATVSVQIIGAGADTVNRNTLSGLANSAGLTLWPGDSVFFASNGGTTWNTFGFAANQQFPFDKSSNGYQKLPSGVIVQWGNIATSGSGGVTLTYPIAFPNAVVSGSMQLVSSPSSTAVHPGMDFSGLSSMTVYTRDATSGLYTAVNCKYILIGY